MSCNWLTCSSSLQNHVPKRIQACSARQILRCCCCLRTARCEQARRPNEAGTDAKVERRVLRLPSRMLATVLSFSSGLEVARSQAVCKSWKLEQELLDRV